MFSMRRHAARSLLGALALIAYGSSCSPAGRPADLAGDRRSRNSPTDAAAFDEADAGVPAPPRVVAQPVMKGKPSRVFVKASTRVLAQDAVNVYYGDSEDDGIYSMPKAGGSPTRIARHTPVAGAIAIEPDAVTWIASPGDAVLRAPIKGGQPTTLRDHGIFSDLATAKGDTFITEAVGAGGALLRVTGATATRLAAFDGPPRVVMADANYAYIVTPTKVFRTAHVKAELETIATGTGFTYAELDESFVYMVGEDEKSGVIQRVPKAGGALTTVAKNVRNAPLEVAGPDLYYFDANRPQLRVGPAGGGDSVLVAEGEGFGAPSAIEADATTLYVATGAHESAVILAIDRK